MYLHEQFEIGYTNDQFKMVMYLTNSKLVIHMTNFKLVQLTNSNWSKIATNTELVETANI